MTPFGFAAAEDLQLQHEEALVRATELVQAKKRARQQALVNHNAEGDALQSTRTEVQQKATGFREEVGFGMPGYSVPVWVCA